ncbi:MAG: hypothetical protein ACI31S_01350 [Bacilli bacterium]
MVNFEITKKQKILEINNDMCHNYYFLIYGRIYNDGKTRYRKFKYIEWFDIFDVQEFFEDKEYITKKDIEEYRDNIEIPYLYNIKNYNDEKGLKEFYNYCNETIEDYNKIARKY